MRTIFFIATVLLVAAVAAAVVNALPSSSSHDENSGRVKRGSTHILPPNDYTGDPNNCVWKGRHPFCNGECPDTHVELARSDGLNGCTGSRVLAGPMHKDGQPLWGCMGGEWLKPVPIGFGLACLTGTKAFCCPLVKN